MNSKAALGTLLAIFYCMVGFAASPPDLKTKPLAKNGVFDLRGETFTKEIALDGQWNFYWQQLITPGNENLTKRRLNFPLR